MNDEINDEIIDETESAEKAMSPMEITLHQVRKEYPADMSHDQCVEYCNEVAWIRREDDERWGLSFKAHGTHGVRSDGTPCCHDVIMSGVTNEYWDVLLGAGPGGQNKPIWNDEPNGIITDPSRSWVAPIKPGSVVDPVEPPPGPEWDRAAWSADFKAINDFYKADEGLQRPGGMVLPGPDGFDVCDIQAMIQWGADLVEGKTVDQVKADIRNSHEWKVKHPA